MMADTAPKRLGCRSGSPHYATNTLPAIFLSFDELVDMGLHLKFNTAVSLFVQASRFDILSMKLLMFLIV